MHLEIPKGYMREEKPLKPCFTRLAGFSNFFFCPLLSFIYNVGELLFIDAHFILISQCAMLLASLFFGLLAIFCAKMVSMLCAPRGWSIMASLPQA